MKAHIFRYPSDQTLQEHEGFKPARLLTEDSYSGVDNTQKSKRTK
jgi:hypothetical protein